MHYLITGHTGFKGSWLSLMLQMQGHTISGISLDPNDFFGYIQAGNVQFHAPPLFGGSKQEALTNYLKAKVLMEKDTITMRDDWNYLSLLSSIAENYKAINDNAHAKLVYEEILKIEPDFKWVRDELYPKLLKNLKQ